jgi:hypothetical protein
VGHHPPVSAFHAESLSREFLFYGSIYPKVIISLFKNKIVKAWHGNNSMATSLTGILRVAI